MIPGSASEATLDGLDAGAAFAPENNNLEWLVANYNIHYLIYNRQVSCKTSFKNLAKKTRTLYLWVTFNTNQKQYNKNVDSANFLDAIFTNFRFPYISRPSFITRNFKIFIYISLGCHGNLLVVEKYE